MDIRKSKVFYLAPVLLSIAITSLPLLTKNWLGLENSLYLMYSAEFVLAIAIIIYIYRGQLNFGNKIFFLCCLVFIVIIYVTLYVKREPNFEAFHISANHLIPYFFAVFIIPFSEECIYRGCLVDFFCGILKGNVFWPVILSSIVFCAMHTQYTGLLDFAVLFSVSLIFSFARLKSGSLLQPIFLHSFMNGFVVLLTNLSVF
ncbi:lysostaphin resistance A-like protein [Cronobacter dublinensis]|uniref:CPBP family intramembrane glutamic endopeptidase n=1 Tax=Cronobacter dublinensis TaxID=413497 RepID=UPI003D345942